ncbi:MAG: dihydrodipicolinate synthase family protein, partial [Dermatophilaceae bacterium]
RVAYAAPHVIPRVLADNTPGASAVVDWDATLAFRRELWSWGLGVADAMDTAQRGMGLDWPAARQLVTRSATEARAVGGRLACGAGTDQLDLAALPSGRAGRAAVLAAYREQIEVVAGSGATVIVMASRALAATADGPEAYTGVYDAILSESTEPVILHWLGEVFDPALAGYWGDRDLERATETFVGLVAAHAARVDGVKVSLLDAGHERALRTRLAGLDPPVRLYTGDDLNYPELIDDDGTGHSDALLGALSAIYPAAAAALALYDERQPEQARSVLDRTVELSRHLFAAPTPYYKVGIAFLAWLNGHQPGFAMVGGLQSARSVPHLVQTFVLADRAGLLLDPDRAAHRMSGWLAVHGIDG